VHCGKLATDVDHEPLRRELVVCDVRDPDADVYLCPRYHSCHSRKMAKETGFGGRQR
jgi:hypothetical protein